MATTNYCTCPTSTRPPVKDGGCPNCGLKRAPKAIKTQRFAHRLVVREIDPLDEMDNLGASPD